MDRTRLARVGVTIAVCLTVSFTPGQEPSAAADLQAARATLAKWMETQQIISREKKDWQTGKEVLEQRIALLQSEISSLETKIGDARSLLSEANSKRSELAAEAESLKAASDSLADVVIRLEGKTRTLVRSLPEPLKDRIRPLSERVPADSASTSLSLSERYQNVIGILNEVNKFNRDITVTSEIRSMPGGGSAEVKVVYLGLAQAYYVNNKGDVAGVGRPGPDGWTWTPDDAIAPEVASTIAILQSEQVPGYVYLPVRIQ